MKMCSRRRAAAMMLCAGLGAVAPLRASQKLVANDLSLPEGPQKLVRLLDRRFHDGSQFSVLRDWEIRFSREKAGITISGAQSSVETWATPGSEALAHAEEVRSTDAMWPIRLNASGLILVGPRIRLDDLMPEVAGADQLPDDLFYPSIAPLRSHQRFTMSDGRIGEFSLEYEASSVAGKGWLHRARRQIAIRVGSSIESADERWILTD